MGENEHKEPVSKKVRKHRLRSCLPKERKKNCLLRTRIRCGCAKGPRIEKIRQANMKRTKEKRSSNSR